MEQLTDDALRPDMRRPTTVQIQEADIFTRLDERVLDRITLIAEARVFETGTVLFNQGDLNPPFCILIGGQVSMFRTALDGTVTRLTETPDGALHYHPQPSPDGKWLAYGSLRGGVRNIYILNLADRTETRVTDLKPGHGAMWPHWQPLPKR